MEEPEFCEILDKNGQIIYGLDRIKIISSNNNNVNRYLEVEEFFEEIETRDDTLKDMFDSALSDLDPDQSKQYEEDPEIKQLVSVLSRMICEFDVALGYVRASGATLHADIGSELLAEARKVIKLFE